MTSTTAAVCHTPHATAVVLNPDSDATSLGSKTLSLSPWPNTPNVPSPNVKSCPDDVIKASHGPEDQHYVCRLPMYKVHQPRSKAACELPESRPKWLGEAFGLEPMEASGELISLVALTELELGLFDVKSRFSYNI
nr:hypothetical protein Itr_chr14CG27740 [Ipomoea trifida]